MSSSVPPPPPPPPGGGRPSISSTPSRGSTPLPAANSSRSATPTRPGQFSLPKSAPGIPPVANSAKKPPSPARTPAKPMSNDSPSKAVAPPVNVSPKKVAPPPGATIPSPSGKSPQKKPEDQSGVKKSNPVQRTSPSAKPTAKKSEVGISNVANGPVAKFVIAADKDVIEDWKERNLQGEVAFNVPVREAIERLLQVRLKWDDGLADLVVVETRGEDFVSLIPIPESVVEINLTPKELKWESSGKVYYLWLQRGGKLDEPPRSRGEIFKERLRKFYRYYAPEKEHEVDSILTDFHGSEDLLFAKLVGMYGAEPTDDQLRRVIGQRNRMIPWSASDSATTGIRNTGPSPIGTLVHDLEVQHQKESGIFDEKQEVQFNPNRPSEILTAAAKNQAQQSSRRKFRAASSEARPANTTQMFLHSQPSSEFAGLGDRLLGNLTSVMSRVSESSLIYIYYLKWIGFHQLVKRRKKVVVYMLSNLSSFVRKDAFSKWTAFTIAQRLKHKLHQSAQIAAKSESVVGDLAAENSFLKGEVKRLRAQVEMLDNNNARRLESLYNSSEMAVAQIRTLSAENLQKEKLIDELEQRLMSIGNMMLKANDEKEQVLESSSVVRLQLEHEIETLKSKITTMEEALDKANEELSFLRPVAKRSNAPICQHCPHYFDAVNEIELLHKNADALRARVHDTDNDKKILQETVAALGVQLRREHREKRELTSQTHRGHNPKAPVQSKLRFAFDEDLPQEVQVARSQPTSPGRQKVQRTDRDNGSRQSMHADYLNRMPVDGVRSPSTDTTLSSPPPPPPPDDEGDSDADSTSLADVMSSSATSTDIFLRQQQQQTSAAAAKYRDVMDWSAKSEVQGSLLPPALQHHSTTSSHRGQLSSVLSAQVRQGGSNGPPPVPAVVPPVAFAAEPSALHPIQSPPASLNQFFSTEERRLEEKLRLQMDRYTNSRLRTAGFAADSHGTIHPSVEARFRETRVQQLSRVYDGIPNHQLNPAASASLFGSTRTEGTVPPVTLRQDQQEVLDSFLVHGVAPHQRLKSQPERTAVETQLAGIPGAPRPDPAAMRRNIFANSGKH